MPDSGLDKIKVLIVEDNPITSMDLKEILRQQGFDVIGVAKSYEEATHLFQKKPCDLALVDISLIGEKTGIDFAIYLQQSNNHKIPVVFLTANSDEETKRQAFELMPAAFLLKPFKPENLLNALELAFSNSARFREDHMNYSEPIFIKDQKEYAKIYENEILFVKANGSYCEVVTESKQYLLSLNLNSCIKRLNPKNFLRIHRSYLINKEMITELNNSFVQVRDHKLPVGRSYKESILTSMRKLP
jgi:DNA-binding LytR/AlgR family response regulator